MEILIANFGKGIGSITCITDIYYITVTKPAKKNKKNGPRKDRKKKVFLRDNYQCCYCGRKLFTGGGKHVHPTVDHIIPLCEGGSNSIDNLLTSCSKCNNKKGSQSFEAFVGTEVFRIALKEID